MGNMAYQAATKYNIDKLVWDMRSEISNLERRNRKLTGALKKKRNEHIKLCESEFLEIEDIDDIDIGDILEIICTKEEYISGGDEYEWPFTVNKPYKVLVIYKWSAYNGYVTLLFLDYANYKDKSYRADCYKLSEELDFYKYDFEAEVFKIRRIYKANQEEIEFYKR